MARGTTSPPAGGGGGKLPTGGTRTLTGGVKRGNTTNLNNTLIMPSTHRQAAQRPSSVEGVRWACGRAWWVCGLVLVLLSTPSTLAESNRCDFYGSGLEQDGRGVQPVYLGCGGGRVVWQYPRAALRVILRSPHPGREFQGCIKGGAMFGGARVYLEGHRSLLPLLAPDDDKPRDLVRCFTSYQGQAALYVEAQPANHALTKHVADFEYDLRTLPKDATYDPLQECRPCSSEEMLRLYCSGDFVARGFITNAQDLPDLDKTSITVKASKLFQQTSPVFRHASRKSAKKDDGGVAWGENEVDGEGYLGRVEVPLQCGARAGQGEFVVMGVMRLGQPVLRCAPKHEEWKKLVRESRAEAQCVLET